MSNESDKINISLSDMTDEDKKTLLGLIRKYSNKENKRWKPEYNDPYYYITGHGGINRCNSCICDEIDNKRFNLRNCFKTKEEAKFELERRKIIAELQNYADEHNTTDIDWNNHNQGKYFIYYSYALNKLDISCTSFSKQAVNVVYFTSREIAESAVKYVGKDRILKYIFGIEVDENEEK